MKTMSIFGATGTLGRAALDVAFMHPNQFAIHALAANQDKEALYELSERHAVTKAILTSRDGDESLCELARDKVDLVIMAIGGMAALKPTLAAIRAGQTIAFASKEALVGAGQLMMDEAKKHKATLLPLDSEHNAIFQCWPDRTQMPKKIVLTASGGPFLNKTLNELKDITPEQACAHPKWSMGAKISVDSATMMNKGLEVIEAHYLFELPADKIDILIHPQSIVHGMVEYDDGSVLTQMGPHDMRTPMTNVMFWPERGATSGPDLKIGEMRELTFKPVDTTRFRAVHLAYEALKDGQSACIALNAANEVAVQAFLDKKIGFLDIIDTVEEVLSQTPARVIDVLDDVFAFDQDIRIKTLEIIKK